APLRGRVRDPGSFLLARAILAQPLVDLLVLYLFRWHGTPPRRPEGWSQARSVWYVGCITLHRILEPCPCERSPPYFRPSSSPSPRAAPTRSPKRRSTRPPNCTRCSNATSRPNSN